MPISKYCHLIIFLVFIISCKENNNRSETGSSSDSSIIVSDAQLNSDTIPCTGALGDVKYSILDPTNFKRENGNCWILMDSIGREQAQKFLLFQRYKIDTIPDARGVFVRSMNEGRNKDYGEAGGDREIGSYQGDLLKTHQHSLDTHKNPVLSFDSESGNPPLTPNIPAPGFAISIVKRSTDTGTNTGQETRPRNICLYLYIKVN